MSNQAFVNFIFANWHWFLVLAWFVVLWIGVWTWGEWKDIDEPHTYDARLAQHEIDILKAEAEEEAYASRQRRRVRAGKK